MAGHVPWYLCVGILVIITKVLIMGRQLHWTLLLILYIKLFQYAVERLEGPEIKITLCIMILLDVSSLSCFCIVGNNSRVTGYDISLRYRCEMIYLNCIGNCGWLMDLSQGKDIYILDIYLLNNDLWNIYFRHQVHWTWMF